MRRMPPCALRSATATCSRRRSTAAPTSSRSACRSTPPAASRTRPRPSISARGSSTRPRTPARASAPASTATPRTTRDLAAGGVLEMLAIAGQPQVDLREGRRRGERLPVEWVRIDVPDPELTKVGDPRRPQPGLAQGRREVQPPRRLLGGRQHDLLRLHERWRRQERRRQQRRVPRGIGAGLGVPARPPRRDADARLRVAVRRRPRLARQPHGDAPRRPDRLRGRRVVGLRGYAPARARDRQRQPLDRHHPARRRVRAGGQRAQRLRAGRRELQPERPHAVLQPVRARPLRRGPGRGDDVRRHRARYRGPL